MILASQCRLLYTFYTHWILKDSPFTCIVTNLSSTITSLVRKSAPMVALYWLLNFLFTYWFMRDVLPTLQKQNSELNHNSPFLWRVVIYIPLLLQRNIKVPIVLENLISFWKITLQTVIYQGIEISRKCSQNASCFKKKSK